MRRKRVAARYSAFLRGSQSAEEKGPGFTRETHGHAGGGLQHRAPGAFGRISPGRGRPAGRGAKAASAPRVWASVERTPEQVTEEVCQEARRRDPEGKRPWVMWVEGHEGQLEDIHAAIERHGVELTLILDFIRVLEHSGRPLGVSSSPRMSGGGGLGRRTGLADPPSQGQRCGRRHAAQCHLTQPLPRGAQGTKLRACRIS